MKVIFLSMCLFFVVCSSMDFAMDASPPVIRDLVSHGDNEHSSNDQPTQDNSTEEEDCCNDRCVCIFCPFMWLWIKYIENYETF